MKNIHCMPYIATSIILLDLHCILSSLDKDIKGIGELALASFLLLPLLLNDRTERFFDGRPRFLVATTCTLFRTSIGDRHIGFMCLYEDEVG